MLSLSRFAAALIPLFVAAGCAAGDDESGQEPTTESERDASEPAPPPPPSRVTDFKEPAPASPAPPRGRFAHLDPEGLVPAQMLAEALAYFEANEEKIENTSYLTVVDFSAHSGKQRFFVVDMTSGAVDTHVVAHGSGSDADNDGVAEKFSNVPGSNASSVGFYLASEVYSGKWGRSMRLDGLSPTNSNARPRAVVFHGGDYVENTRAVQGRSWGCLVLPLDEKDAVIDILHGGSLLYASSGDPATSI